MIFDDALKDEINVNDTKRTMKWKPSYLNNRITTLDIEIPEIGGEVVDELFPEDEYKLIQDYYSVKGNMYRWKPTEESKKHTDAVKAGIARKNKNKEEQKNKWKQQIVKIKRQQRLRKAAEDNSSMTEVPEISTECK